MVKGEEAGNEKWQRCPLISEIQSRLVFPLGNGKQDRKDEHYS
jgi:hypothetical protein